MLGFLVLLPALASAFTHPGLLHTNRDFQRVIAKVNDGSAEPWKTGWNKLTSNSLASPTYEPSAVETVYRGTGYPENYRNLFRDAHAAYQLALRWKISGNATFADAAARVLDDWSGTLKVVNGSSDKFLAAGLYGYQLANAAEILRDYSEWTGLEAIKDLGRRIFYPMNHDFLVRHNDAEIDHYWANWDLCNIASMQAWGVVLDNETMYNEAVDYFTSTGQGNGNIEKMIWKLHQEEGSNKMLGQGQEAGRDQGHALLDFGLLGVIAQQSYNQGHDLFALGNNRILAGAEYAAKYNLGHDVPFSPLTTSTHGTQEVISPDGRGGIRPIWELLYAHYGVLKGLNASWTEQYRDLVVKNGSGAEGGGGNYGPNSGGFDNFGFGTLMYRLE
ncbi:chondroitin AC/alginate lyase [Corynespora cassiicola Philippines]|uniref:Chondroitin AC/alginate lyase n=1 Tax=Corynespora cassiicola Philippines TaxID=1448308 RepID=A0A2T2N709_CORCC|nr:chondroitin AC/alginate lyase [Corynespora cassiicola Philippines]